MRFLRVLGVSLVSRTVVVSLHSLAIYSDQMRRGGATALAPIGASLIPAYAPWALFAAVLYLVLSAPKRAARLGQPATVARMFSGGFVLFFLPDTFYEVLLVIRDSGAALSAFPAELAKWPARSWLVDFGLFVCTFAVIYGAIVVRASRDAEQRKQQLQAENLALTLELEQRRLVALRAQLKPHFMFNALNAISGLVRGDNKTVALSALQQTSGLLRYALTASGRDAVTIGDELGFVRGYVTLQTLRFGDRLRVSITGESAEVEAAECPPLILQPIIENAIRRGLETHEDAGDVDIVFSRVGDIVNVRVSNPLVDGAAPNPGTGFGLKATRDRLALAYAGAATCDTSSAGGRFTVSITLPSAPPQRPRHSEQP